MEFFPLNSENNRNARETPADSLIYELAKDDESTEFALPVDSSSLDTHRTESVPSDWTDEKHHLFLESMEASFVSQMFDSAHSGGSGCGSGKENSSRTKLHGQNQSASHVHSHFGQFKVLRRGSWKNIDFEPTKSRPNLLNNDHYQTLSRNPWIHHFRATCKNKNVACKSQATGSRGRNLLPFGAANNPGPTRACDSDYSKHFISGNKEEVSDQNFVDEDRSEAEKGSSDCNAKRGQNSRKAETNALINDQVVP